MSLLISTLKIVLMTIAFFSECVIVNTPSG